jgi:hypothetical protein
MCAIIPEWREKHHRKEKTRTSNPGRKPKSSANLVENIVLVAQRQSSGLIRQLGNDGDEKPSRSKIGRNTEQKALLVALPLHSLAE